jgi:hypothetical protein
MNFLDGYRVVCSAISLGTVILDVPIINIRLRGADAVVFDQPIPVVTSCSIAGCMGRYRTVSEAEKWKKKVYADTNYFIASNISSASWIYIFIQNHR